MYLLRGCHRCRGDCRYDSVARDFICLACGHYRLGGIPAPRLRPLGRRPFADSAERIEHHRNRQREWTRAYRLENDWRRRGDCPVCGQGEGELCRTSGRYHRVPHPARFPERLPTGYKSAQAIADRRRVVDEYLQGTEWLVTVGQRHGISASTLKRWTRESYPDLGPLHRRR